MDNELKKWNFQGNQNLSLDSVITVRSLLNKIMENLSKNDSRPVISLGNGDPSLFPCYRTTPIAEDAIVHAVRSAKFNGYPPSAGILSARRAVTSYLSKDFPYKLSSDDIFLTLGCTQAIEVTLKVLSRPGANILLPIPGFPYYESHAAHCHLEARHFDLLPEKGWEVDLKAVEALADDNTVAMVIINPGNPCGNVFSYQHLEKLVNSIRGYLNMTSEPATFIQGAVPQILEQTKEDFFLKIIDTIKEAAEILYGEAASLTSERQNDDMDFCQKLAREESVVVLPGMAVGLKNWVRINFAIEPSSLKDGLRRIKAFCQRYDTKREYDEC